MENQAVEAAGAAAVRTLPPAPNRANLTLGVGELAEVYMAAWSGRDPSRPYAVAWWVRQLGDRRILELDANTIADVLDRYAAEPVTKYVGKDKAGEKRLRTFGRRAPATVNRQRSVLSAMLTFAKRKRFTPRDWRNPVHDIPAEAALNGRVRFLSAEERGRLLKICRMNAWPRMYLFVLMALTTGARKGELLGLRYADLDLVGGTAHVRATCSSIANWQRAWTAGTSVQIHRRYGGSQRCFVCVSHLLDEREKHLRGNRRLSWGRKCDSEPRQLVAILWGYGEFEADAARGCARGREASR